MAREAAGKMEPYQREFIEMALANEVLFVF